MHPQMRGFAGDIKQISVNKSRGKPPANLTGLVTNARLPEI
jgi:hypothetical protein